MILTKQAYSFAIEVLIQIWIQRGDRNILFPIIRCIFLEYMKKMLKKCFVMKYNDEIY